MQLLSRYNRRNKLKGRRKPAFSSRLFSVARKPAELKMIVAAASRIKLRTTRCAARITLYVLENG